MSIYGNIFKPIEAPSEEVIQLAEAFEAEVIQEATELGIYNEAKFHLFKIGDSAEYKKLEEDLKDAEQILNANNEELDVNKVGHAMLHGTDKIVNVINAGTSIAALPNPVFLPIALGAKLASVALKSGKEKEALQFTDEAIVKLQGILDSTESDVEKERIQNCIDKLLKSKHVLEVGKKGVKKEEKAVKKEEKAIAKAEKKDAREEKKALKKAAKAVKKNKDTDEEEDDEDVISQVEAADLVNFCTENNVPLSEEQINTIMNIVTEGCNNCDKKDENIDEDDRKEVNDKAAKELTSKKESAMIYNAFRALMNEASDEQIENFLASMSEATADQIEAMKNNPNAVKKFNKGLAKKMSKNDEAQGKAADAVDRLENIDSFSGAFSAGINAAKAGAKAIKSEIKTDKAIEDTIDRDETAAYKENERKEKAAEKAEKKAKEAQAKADAKEFKKIFNEKLKNPNPGSEKLATESVEDLFNFVIENDIEITEDLYNIFVEAGLIEAAQPEFESYEEFVNYCIENGIQRTKEELEAIKESFIKEAECVAVLPDGSTKKFDSKEEKEKYFEDHKEELEFMGMKDAKKHGQIYVS